ncbi:hypothetical protein [Rhizobium sp.]|jgi:hypothetical protein|uniref:hypothetical protein n=1 Tax=Rhizobium sp. TaxID=391 RepID=UPI000E7FD7D8|nr:hypothetical protein [Rhizobium sp.]
MIKRQYNICIVEPTGFKHAMVFREIAEALGYSFKGLGHDVALQINQLSSDAINIIIGAHLLTPQDITGLPPQTIIVNAEPLSATNEEWRQRTIDWLKAGVEIWDYSQANIDILRQIGGRAIKHLKLGYQPELDRIPQAETQDIDVLFYGSINARRASVLDAMKARGLKVRTLFGVYGQERDAWIARSKVVLNMHYYESQIFEVVRVFYLLSNGIPVVGEVNGASTLIEKRFADGIVAASYDDLANVTADLLRDPARLMQQRAIARESIRNYPQTIFTQELI